MPHPKHPLQITTRTARPDFKFELLPLHSPLLRQSLLVSFPPLIDMLKFSGYPYLIRGQSLEVRFRGAEGELVRPGRTASLQRDRNATALGSPAAPPLIFGGTPSRGDLPRPSRA